VSEGPWYKVPAALLPAGLCSGADGESLLMNNVVGGLMVRGLRAILTILGAIALVVGSVTVITGGALVVGAGDVSPTVDSELRFLSAWYAAAGVLILRAARRPESAGPTVRAVSVILLVGATARAVSIAVVGVPHPLALALMAIEFAIPAVILPWQAAVERRTR
jgi:hypothetical protein